ncbi:MAG TPA: tetratricopeptide repeat protein [Thermomicrobiales bacterium]|nr:tetratricopeptide repeat protein [Thermomicrobiales bacterium]
MASLTTPLSSFVGREADIARVCSLLSSTRLLTLTGPGGIGKTRLALVIARAVAAEFGDGVFFVSLAPVSDPALVISTIAAALRVQETADRTTLHGLMDLLAGKQALLVLDNFEQVIDAAPVVAALLGACPRLKVLITSRMPLRIAGEQEAPVQPLALPDDRGVMPAEAVDLFVQRARARRPSFDLTDENAPIVAAICRALDGLPLAIELAAARITLLSPQLLLARLDKRLSLLTGGSTGDPLRQRTMRNTIAWSYDLLGPDEQRLFRQLSVFAGGWTIEAAAAVAASDGTDTGILEGISVLIDHSLVQAVSQIDEPRYSMLETLREYAGEQLDAAGEAESVRDRHLSWSLAFAEHVEANSMTQAMTLVVHDDEWAVRIERELDNVRAALAWSVAEGKAQPARGLRLAAAVSPVWSEHGRFSEGREWFARLLSAPMDGAVAPAVLAEAVGVAGWLAVCQGDHAAAQPLLAQSLDLYQQLGDERGVGWTCYRLGEVPQQQGDLESAAALFAEGMRLLQAHGDTSGYFLCTIELGITLQRQGDYDRARALYEECLAIAVAHRWTTAHAWSLLRIADAALGQGDAALAFRYAEQSVAMHRAATNEWGLAWALLVLGNVLRSQQDNSRAADVLLESFRLHRASGQLQFIPNCLESLAAISRAQPEHAARLIGAAQALRARLSLPIAPADRDALDALLAGLEELLGQERFEQALSAGRALSLDEAIAEASAQAPTAPPEPAADLTPREVEVLRLIVEGHSNQEIAARLFVSQHTVASHVAHILSKVGVESRTAAATWAMRHGLV